MRVMIALDLRNRACGEKLSAILSRAGAKVDQIVGRADDIGIVLDDQDGVAEIAQVFEDADQLGGVAGMQADGGLVQHVQRADEPRAKRCGELDALRFAAGKRGGETVEREVIEADSIEETQCAAAPLSR